MKRLSRSASSWMLWIRSSRVDASIASLRLVADPRIDASGVRRSCEIDVSSAARSRSVSADQASAIHVLDQIDPLDRQRRLVGQRIEQPVLIRRQDRTRLVAIDADHADRAAPGVHRHEQSLGTRQRIGAATRGAVPLPTPLRGGKVSVVQHVLRRKAGAHRDPPILRQQDDDTHLQHQRDLMHGRPQQIVKIRRARQLAAELVQLLGGARPLSRDDRLRPHTRGQIAGDHRGHAEEEQCGDVLRVGDGECVERRQKEEVVGQHADKAGEQRRPQSVHNRGHQHGRQERHRHAGDTQPLVQQERAAQ